MTKHTLEESLSMFMAEIAKRLDENTNLIKEIQASMDFALRNQKASIKALEIQVRKMSIILHERLSGNLQRLIEIKPRVNDETIYTSVKADKPSIHRIDASQYADELKETDGEKDLEAHYTNAKTLGKALPRKEKDLGSFTLPCFIKNMCYKALADLGASSLEPLNGDYIELNDLNEPFKLRRNQGDDLMPTIEEGEVIEEFRTRDDELDTGIDDYPRFEFTHVNFFPLLYVNVMSKKFHNSIMKDKMMYKGNNVIGALMNVSIFVGSFSVMTNFAVLEDMDAYHDEGMGDVIFGKPFLREVGIKARRFEGMITIYNGNESVTYQMVRSHPRFKHHTNEQCNKIPPLLKVSDEDKKNGISHPYQKLKGFYKGVLNLGPDYIRDAKTEEWLTRGHISVHEMEW
ncbi:hypothetical protein Tco_0572665 [Tanacetum coccineum]